MIKKAYQIARDKKMLIITICILLLGFCWGMFFTSGLPFFWEDFGSYSIGGAKSLYTVPAIAKSFINELFSTKRFFKLGFANLFSDRPYQYLTNSLLGILFGNQVVFYRCFKSLILAMVAALIFFIISRASVLFALLGVALYLASCEVWAILASSMDVAIYSQFTTLLTIVIFLRMIDNKEQRKIVLWWYYLAILIISQYSALSKNDGRYLAVIFFLTLFFFQRKKLIFHLPMLLMLFIFEIPVLGYLKNIFAAAHSPVINLQSHNSPSLAVSLKIAMKNYIFPLSAVGKVLTAVFIFSVGVDLFHKVLYRAKGKNAPAPDEAMQLRSFVFFIWFIFALGMISLSRSFSYEGLADISVGECSYFILPFSIFICCYICSLRGYFSKVYRSLFIVFCFILIASEVVIFKLPRLNHFRGSWGNYFCAWENAKKYVNRTSDHALVLAMVNMRYTPFMFWGSNNEVIPNISVYSADFAGIVDDRDALFSNLVVNGYLDEEGIIQNKFTALNDASGMTLASKYDKKKKRIFEILSIGSNTPAENCPFSDLTYIESKFYKGGFDHIFVISREVVDFKNKPKTIMLSKETIVDGDSGDLYDRFKRFIGRPSRPILHIYDFKLSSAMGRL